MTFLVPLMMWGWIPINVILFRKFTPQKAILISVIGGVLFLPVTTYDLPGINYNKNVALAISLLIGIILSGKKTDLAIKPKLVDIPIVIWCSVSPLLSLIANNYAFRHVLYAIINISLEWGVFYLVGRIYFSNKDSMRLLTKGIIIGGLIYVPLVFFEVRMSPQLSNIFYGFIPHDFLQLIRYGGYRPIVFMNHALMVSLWMSLSYIVSLWLYGTREIIKIYKIPLSLSVILLFISTILCKCSGAILFLVLGTFVYYYHKKFKSKKIFILLILSIPVYIILRLSGTLPIETILDYVSMIFQDFDADRIDSLGIRLFQEEMFGQRALERPILGWGGMDRSWPTDIITGESLVQMIDSLYLMMFSIRGVFGLFSLYAFLLIGPWKIMKSRNNDIDATVLSLILIFFVIDSLLNSMMNPVFVLIAGALVSFSERLEDDEHTVSNDS